MKVTIIGSGSVMFTRMLLSSMLAYDSIRKNINIMLEDISEKELNRSYDLVYKMFEQENISGKVEKTTDQKEAVKNADFVISTIQVGGFEAWEIDKSIPSKYGVTNEGGDTMGPGGVFRGLRHIPVTCSILKDMEELCPNALFINYANPMAPVTWAANDFSSKIKTIGLCYGVPFNIAQLAGYLGIGPWVEHPWKAELWDKVIQYGIPENVECDFGGINHMTWILKYNIDGEDLYPKIRELYKDSKVYEADGVRCEILKHFNFWTTENHWHMSDYLPYFRKNEEMIDHFIPRRWNLIPMEKSKTLMDNEEIGRQIRGELKIDIKKNMFNAPKIINSIISKEVIRVSGNVKNNGLIKNLPDNCIVEVPIFVDKNGLSPSVVGELPIQCAALNRTNINVQELIVEGALKGDIKSAKQALMLDPLTSAICTLDQIDSMFEEMLKAERKWLPEFE